MNGDLDILTVGQLVDQRNRARDIAMTLEGELQATKPVIDAARAVDANPYPPGTREITRAIEGLQALPGRQDVLSAREIADKAAAAAKAVVRLHVALRNYYVAIDQEQSEETS